MKKILNYKYGEQIVYSTFFFVNFLFTLILYSLRLRTTGESVWSSMGYSNDGFIIEYSSVYDSMYTTKYLSIALVVLFFVGFLLTISSIVLHVLKRKKIGYYFSIPYQIGLQVILIIMHVAVKMLSAGAIVLSVLNLLLMSVCLAIFLIYGREAKVVEKKEVESKQDKVYKRCILIIEGLSMIFASLIFFMPIYKVTTEDGISTTYILINSLGKTRYEAYFSIIFILMFLLFITSFIYFISTISSYFRKDKSLALVSKSSLYGNVGLTLVFFITGFFICFIKKATLYPATCVPFVLSLLLLIVYSIFQGKLSSDLEIEPKDKGKTFYFEPLLYIILLTVCTFLCLFLNVLQIDFKSSFFKKSVVLTGYKLLTTYKDLGGGFQILSFLVLAVLITSSVLCILSISSFFAKYKDYYKVVKVTAITNVIFMLLLGLFGMYFRIAQKVNEETISALLDAFHITMPTEYTYAISCQTIYLFIASFIIFLIMIFRGQLNHHIADESILKLSKDSALGSRGGTGSPAPSNASLPIDFDACPAFTELDSKIELYKSALEHRHQSQFDTITLPNLVRFIVDYARESRLHLSYSLEDIATFVAGLGASRLAILQGMSGTGKTSLPKIFAEAIMGTCDIVEVESSWRDKNELLGYYNEFSKCYTPKKFTQCLYKAKLNPSVPTFIVLDEMNLSRIEYYFSDFLSLMENEEDKREIKLLNVKLSRIVQEQPHEYYGLVDGHTIKIPTNVWFIGTANKDESTFEISDKVYDRAQTMNFNKRAPKVYSFSEPLSPKFASYEQIAHLFEEAKQKYKFEAEDNKIISKVEKLLIPYNISFGNRILKQMEDFVKIYCACFGDKDAVVDDAVEKIVLSKVVSKLEYKIVENKEELALEFDKLGLSLCSQFVRKLNED